MPACSALLTATQVNIIIFLDEPVTLLGTPSTRGEEYLSTFDQYLTTFRKQYKIAIELLVIHKARCQVDISFTVCYVVILWVCTVTYFSAEDKASNVKFLARWFDHRRHG